jgi:hypothetical protein
MPSLNSFQRFRPALAPVDEQFARFASWDIEMGLLGQPA